MRKPLVACLGLLTCPFLVAGAAAAEVEVGFDLGYRSGGLVVDTNIDCIQAPCPTTAESDASPLLGTSLGIGIGHDLSLELRASRQEADFDLAGGGFDEDVALDLVQVGVLRSFTLGEWRPFVAAGVGGVRISTDGSFGGDEEAFAGSIAGGAKRDLAGRFGLRLEGRGHWLDLSERLGGDRTLVETTAGVTIRFG